MIAPSRSIARNRSQADRVDAKTATSTENAASGRIRVAYVLTALCEGGLERFTLDFTCGGGHSHEDHPA